MKNCKGVFSLLKVFKQMLLALACTTDEQSWGGSARIPGSARDHSLIFGGGLWGDGGTEGQRMRDDLADEEWARRGSISVATGTHGRACSHTGLTVKDHNFLPFF